MFGLGKRLLAAGKALASECQKTGVRGEDAALNSTSSFVRPQIWRDIEAANKQQKAAEEEAAAVAIAAQIAEEEAAAAAVAAQTAEKAFQEQLAAQEEADNAAWEAAAAAAQAAAEKAAWQERWDWGKRITFALLDQRAPSYTMFLDSTELEDLGLDSIGPEERGYI